VIVEQASKLLLNYVLLARQSLGGPKVAFWGHGCNFQRHRASRVGETVKRIVSRWPHWWFTYTDACAEVVRRLPYPPERISVVQNAIDTGGLLARRAVTDCAALTELRRQWGIRSQNIAIYVGGLYAEKRVGFLVAAARAVRRRVPDFELIVVGAGSDQVLVEEACREHRWIHYAGPRFGPDQVPFWALSRLMLLPGAVGLAVLDAFAMEVPLVTIDLTGHGPEIEYLRDGENGLMLPAGASAEDYATVVASLLSDQRRQDRLRAGCRAAARVYTLDVMVDRFAHGVLQALGLASSSTPGSDILRPATSREAGCA
jgi:glycosyltransferase involved in cell wall biosynthesis